MAFRLASLTRIPAVNHATHSALSSRSFLESTLKHGAFSKPGVSAVTVTTAAATAATSAGAAAAGGTAAAGARAGAGRVLVELFSVGLSRPARGVVTEATVAGRATRSHVAATALATGAAGTAAVVAAAAARNSACANPLGALRRRIQQVLQQRQQQQRQQQLLLQQTKPKLSSLLSSQHQSLSRLLLNHSQAHLARPHHTLALIQPFIGSLSRRISSSINRGFTSSRVSKGFTSNSLSASVAGRSFASWVPRLSSGSSSHRGLQWLQRRQSSWWSGNPDTVVWALIGTNLAVFAAWHTVNQTFMARNFMVSVNSVYERRYHTLLTSAVSHREGRHLLFNMLGLYFFGTEVARMFGPRYFLGLYATGAVVASLAHVLYFQYIVPRTDRKSVWAWHPRLSPPAMGASGAVNAIVLFSCLLHPTRIIYLNLIIPVPSILLGVLYVAQDLYGAAVGGSRIGHAAHLGGAAVGVVAWALRRGRYHHFR